MTLPTHRPFAVLILGAALFAGSCASTPRATGSPEQVAARILTALDERRADDAGELFDDVAASETHRQQIYPVLYEAAQDRYARGDASGSSTLLTFLADAYPDAQAVRRALLYSLFLERAQADAADPALLERMEAAVRSVRSQPRPPIWADLVETQLRIDQGRLAEALDSFERFAGAWNGLPEAIGIYVDDIERYLASH